MLYFPAPCGTTCTDEAMRYDQELQLRAAAEATQLRRKRQEESARRKEVEAQREVRHTRSSAVSPWRGALLSPGIAGACA